MSSWREGMSTQAGQGVDLMGWLSPIPSVGPFRSSFLQSNDVNVFTFCRSRLGYGRGKGHSELGQ